MEKSSDITFKYNSETYRRLGEAAHLKGMLVSAMLWKARNQQSGADYFEFDQMIVNALDYVPSGRLSYGDLVLGIMASDKEISGGKFCADIYAAARSYAVDQLFDGNCSDFNDPAQGPGGDRIIDVSKGDEGAYKNGINSDKATLVVGGATATQSSGTVRKRTVVKEGCSIGASRDASVNWMLIVLVSLPLGLVFLRTFFEGSQLSPVRIKVESKRRN